MGKPAKTDIWMPFYVADYIADTPYLTTEQHGAYLLLILAYWRSGPPPDDDGILAATVKMDAKGWRKTRPVLERFFTVAGGVWTHRKIDSVKVECSERMQKASDHAVRAAVIRQLKRHGVSSDSCAGVDIATLRAWLEQCSEQCSEHSPSICPGTTNHNHSHSHSKKPPTTTESVFEKENIYGVEGDFTDMEF